MLTNLGTVHRPDASPAENPPGRLRKPQRARLDIAPLTPPASRAARRWYAPVRRALDFAAALTLLVVSSPVLLLAAMLVRLTSRGPAFYTQTRTGRSGRTFTIYKVRTMIDNCESLTGPRWTMPGDPRITPLGWLLRRTHVDELPQLFNVLKGDMSMIGPRPERPEFVVKLERAIPGYSARHDVLPGITGLAQVQLPPDTEVGSVRRKLQYDLYYVCHWGPLLDLRIVLGTVLHLLGASFGLLRGLRLVPPPALIEGDAAAAPEKPAPVLHRQAA